MAGGAPGGRHFKSSFRGMGGKSCGYAAAGMKIRKRSAGRALLSRMKKPGMPRAFLKIKRAWGSFLRLAHRRAAA